MDRFELEPEYMDDQKREDQIWMARTGLNQKTLLGVIETIIFMSDKPVSLKKIKKVIDHDLPLRVVYECILNLQKKYEDESHGIRIVEIAEGYQFRTKATYTHYCQKLFNVTTLSLSPTALEVLAIIAYRQPASKVCVDKIRGVDSGHIIRGLMDKRLVKIIGRSDEMGRPILYSTTSEFLEVFSLGSLNDLPPERELETIIQDGIGKTSDIKNLVYSSENNVLNIESFESISEIDNLANKIKDIETDTDFIKSLKSAEKEKNTGKNTGKNYLPSAFDILEDYISKNMPDNLKKDSSENLSKNLKKDEFEISIDNAIDQSFDALFKDSSQNEQNNFKDELDFEEDKMVKKEKNLDKRTNQAIQEAKSLDIDLSFLKDEKEPPILN